MSVSTWKLLSVLLDYPTPAFLAGRGTILAAAQSLPPSDERELLVEFCTGLLADDPAECERRYVRTFDFSRQTALNLTYFVHGDRRQRGVALLKLKRLFGALELDLATDELPDYLPLLLELGDIAGDDVAGAMLAEFRPALEVIGASLHQSGSPYALLLEALLARLGPLTDDDASAALALAQDGPPTEDVGLEPFAPPEVMPVLAHAPTTGVLA